MQDEQLPVEAGLDPQRVAVGEVLSEQVHLQSLDGALDASALLVAGAVPGEVLGMIPIDLRLVLAVNADVPAFSPLEAGLCVRAARTHRLP